MKKQRLTLLLVLALVISLLTIGVSAGNGDAIDLSQATNLTFTESCTLTGESGGQVVLDGTAFRTMLTPFNKSDFLQINFMMCITPFLRLPGAHMYI